MISEQEALERLVAFHDHIAAPPRLPEDDVRRGRSRIRRTRGFVAGGAALTLAALVAALSWGGGGREGDRLLPAGPSPSPSPTASAAAPVAVSMAPLRDESQAVAAMTSVAVAEGEAATWRFRDPQGDSSRGAVDIEQVVVQNFGGQYRLDWMFQVREDYPTAPEPGRRIEYGIVLDTDGDRAADCQIGVSRDVGGTDLPFSSWVTNLRTGVTHREDGPPYGKLVDFRHPAETPSGPMDTRLVRFFFIFAETGPCEGYGARSTFYSWAADGDGRRAPTLDYAPDTAWLQMPSR